MGTGTQVRLTGPTLVRSRFGEDQSEVADPWAEWLRPDGQRTSLTLVDEDLSNNPSRRNVRNALPGNMDGILTENALDSMETEAEVLMLVERCEQLRPNPACAVVHLVSPGAFADPRFPLGRSLQAWKDLLTANGFTDHRVTSASGEWV